MITAPGTSRTIGELVHPVPLLHEAVETIDPWLTAVERHEIVPNVMRYLEARLESIMHLAMMQLEAVRPETLKIRDGRIVAGVRPRQPGQSMAWVDVFEHLPDYDAEPDIVRFVQLHNRLLDELTAMAKANGINIHERNFGTGHYFGRLVLAVRDAAKQLKARPDMTRSYDEMEMGIRNGVDYADDIMATTEAVFSWHLRKIIGKRMAPYAAELGRTPKQLIDQALIQRVEQTKEALGIAAHYERLVKDIRDNLTIHYTMMTTPQGQPSRVIRKQLRDMEQVHPGVIARLEAARAPLDAKIVSGQSVTKQDRINQFGALLTEAEQWRETATKAHLRAVSAQAAAINRLQSEEPHVPGAAFGRPQQRTLNLGRVEMSWARGRLFPDDVAAYLNREFSERPNRVIQAVDDVNSFFRTAQTAVDLGTTQIHLLPLMGAHPKRWAQAVKWMVLAPINPKAFFAHMTEPANRQVLQEMAPYMAMDGPEYVDALMKGGLFEVGAMAAAKTAGRLTGSKEVERRVQAFGDSVLSRTSLLFLAPLNVAKLEVAKALLPVFRAQGQVAELGKFIDSMTGTTSSLAKGLGTNQRVFERTFLFYSPRMFRSTMTLIGMAFHGDLKASEARKALAGMFAAQILIPAAFKMLLSGEPPDDDFFDPTSPWFLSFEVFGRRVSFAGMTRALAVLLGQSEKALAKGEADVFVDIFNRQENPLTRFFTGRLPPASAFLWDALTQKDFMGEPLRSKEDWAAYVLQRQVPMWAQEYVQHWTRPLPGEAAPSGLALPFEVAGLRVAPLTPAQRRDQLREQLAQQEYGRPWQQPMAGTGQTQTAYGLSQREKVELEKKYPQLQAETELARAKGQRNEQLEARFWRDVNAIREGTPEKPGPARQIAALTEQFRTGKPSPLSGNEYRRAIQEREREIAQVPQTIKQTEAYRDVPLTPAEREKAYGDRYAKSEHPEDAFLAVYYVLVDAVTDKNTDWVDVPRLLALRETWKRMNPPEVVAGAMAYVNRNRDPELVRAQESFRQYVAIPRWMGTTPERSAELQKALDQMQAVRSKLPPGMVGKTRVALSMIAKDPKLGGEQMMRSAYEATRRLMNPARRQFRFEHPEITRFYSDLTEFDEEVEAMTGEAR